MSPGFLQTARVNGRFNPHTVFGVVIDYVANPKTMLYPHLKYLCARTAQLEFAVAPGRIDVFNPSKDLSQANVILQQRMLGLGAAVWWLGAACATGIAARWGWKYVPFTLSSTVGNNAGWNA